MQAGGTAAVVLVHGWGFDSQLWHGVRSYLSPQININCIDFGYFDTPNNTQTMRFDEAVIAVGHSLGALWWLTQTDIPWRKLLCINGFARFTACAGYRGVAPRVLQRMRTQLQREPQAVLAAFHQRCGTPDSAQPDSAYRPEPLATGLSWLANRDGRATLAARCQDIHALAAADDLIVPRGLSEDSFAPLPTAQIEFVSTPGHVLPLLDPARCARRIEALL